MSSPALWRRLLAETVGTGLLVTVVVGSGIAAVRLSPHQVGLQLLENSLVTALGLTVLILAFGPVSGAHLNPVVSAVDWWLGRRTRTGLTGPELVPRQATFALLMVSAFATISRSFGWLAACRFRQAM